VKKYVRLQLHPISIEVLVEVDETDSVAQAVDKIEKRLLEHFISTADYLMQRYTKDVLIRNVPE